MSPPQRRIFLALGAALLLAGAAPPPAEPPSSGGRVQVHEHTAFSFRAPRGSLTPADRARAASEVLREVIDDRIPGEPSFELRDEEAQFLLGDRLLFALTAQDAAAEGESSLPRFAEARQQALSSFLKAERRRATLQNLARSVCLVVLLGLVTVLLVRRLGGWSLRLRAWIDSPDDPARAGVVRRALAEEKFRWVLVVLVYGLRFFAQALVIYLFLLGSFSLFETTQAWREQLTAWATAPFVTVAERISTGIPTLLLLFLLLAVVQAGWHAISASSVRIAAGRVRIEKLAPEMVPAVRLLMRAALLVAALLLLAPLLTGQSADLFTRIGFWLLQVIGLALLPLLASAALGIYAVLTRRFPAGSWAELSTELRGVVTGVDFRHVHLESPEAGHLLVPHLLTLFRPMRVLESAPALRVELPVPGAIPPGSALARLRAEAFAFASAKGLGEPEVALVDVQLDHALFRVSLAGAAATHRSELLLRLAASLEPRSAGEAATPARSA